VDFAVSFFDESMIYKPHQGLKTLLWDRVFIHKIGKKSL